jgi:predicted HTH domain antitoxin
MKPGTFISEAITMSTTKTLQIKYPEDLPESLGESEEEFESEMKLLLAAKLYELGRVSSARAAEMADIGRVQFLESLGKFKVSVFNYSPEELRREIRDARRRGSEQQ